MNISDISLLQLTLWTIIGIIAAAVVHKMDPGDIKGGIGGTLVFGVIGAIIGGFLSFPLFQVVPGTMNSTEYVSALGGGLLLALLYHMLFRETNRIKTTTTSLR